MDMQIKTISFSDVVESFYNPRKKLKKDSKKYLDLKHSIETFGVVEPMVINDVNNRLISGHQRLQVYKDLGWTEAEFSVVHIEDEADEKALNVSLNKLKGRWDNRKLSEVLRDIDDEYAAGNLGFDDDEVNDLLGKVTEEDLKQNETVEGQKVANVRIQIVNYNLVMTNEEYSQMEESCIQKGCFTPKEIAEELKNRLIYGYDTND